jgi:1-phosphofructokinase
LIYTVTFNPSLDYVVQLEKLVVGDINRAEVETIYPGGKGINVALVLGNLGLQAKMLGFVAGFTGREIERLAKKNGGDTAFINLDEGYSRINLKISADEETAVNGLGPHIPQEKLRQLLDQIDGLVDGDTLVLAGSIPADIPDDIYEQILRRLAGRAIKTVVDATGDLLRNVLKYKPFLIKPNQYELGELFKMELSGDEEIIAAARRLQDQGAQNVLVSLGGAGAILVAANGSVYQKASPAGTLINSVGAGDSMVAGFLAGYEESDGQVEQALSLGLCAGSASAFHSWLATKEEIEELRESL